MSLDFDDMVDIQINDINIECNVGDIPDIEELPVPPEEEVECDGTETGQIGEDDEIEAELRFDQGLEPSNNTH